MQTVTAQPPRTGDATGGVIPYKNPAALIAYYLGLFSVIPVVGFFLGVPAFILGIVGLRRRRQAPEVKGSVHAWIGILFGGLMSLIWGTSVVMMVSAIANSANS